MRFLTGKTPQSIHCAVCKLLLSRLERPSLDKAPDFLSPPLPECTSFFCSGIAPHCVLILPTKKFPVLRLLDLLVDLSSSSLWIALSRNLSVRLIAAVTPWYPTNQTRKSSWNQYRSTTRHLTLNHFTVPGVRSSNLGCGTNCRS